MIRRTVVIGMVFAIAAFSNAYPVASQSRDIASTFPNRAVRIIVPFAAGAGPDIRARQLAQKLSEQWGQPVIVDNRPGAGGQIGMQQAATSPPDGYTLVMAGQSALAIQPHLTKQPFDPLKDFIPVSQLSKGVMVLVINPQVPAANVKELIELAKQSPGKLNAASWGTATVPHLTLELFKRTASVDVVHVPYKDAPGAVKDLIAGQVQMTFDFMPILGPQIKAGRVRPLAVTGRERLSALPDVPTFSEIGLHELETVAGWQGVAVPAGTPQEIVDKLHASVARVMALPDVRASYLEAGFDPVANTPREFASFIQR